MPAYQYPYRIKMRDTDAASRIFFANNLCIAHETFEAFLEEKGFGTGKMLRETEFHLPIVHAETDFQAPCTVGDELLVEMTCPRIGTTSFTMAYRMTAAASGKAIASAQTVHVSVDTRTGAKAPLPEALRHILGGISA